MNKENRQNRIIQLIEQSDGKQILATRQLSEYLGVSEMTVRRDLQELSREGLLQRQHGGASPVRAQRERPTKEIGIWRVGRGKYSDPFFNEVLEGVDEKLQELGYRIAYVNTRAEFQTNIQAHALAPPSPASGIIMAGLTLDTQLIDYLKATTRAIVTTGNSIGTDYDAVTFDGYNGVYQMVDHLVSHGYSRLAFITGRNDSRQEGFVGGLKAHGLPFDPTRCLEVPYGVDGWTPKLGHTGAEQLMQLPNPPEAIVCASDLIAIGVIQWLHQHKFRVPDDVAVTGFDNIGESAFTLPSLTTVHVHKQLIGALAAERVVKRIEYEDEIPLLIQTPTSLTIRQSCGGH